MISRTGAPKYSYAYHYLDPTDIANYSYIRIKHFKMWYKYRGGDKVLIRDYTPRYDDEYLMSGLNSIESDPGQLKNILLATNVLPRNGSELQCRLREAQTPSLAYRTLK